MSTPAIFLDKDGTLVANVPYNTDPRRIRLMPGAREGLRMLSAEGYRLIVVSNQSGVARGYFDEAALDGMRDRLCGMLAEIGVPLQGFYYCPHHPQGAVPAYAISCACRKPEPGMLHRAARDHDLDLPRSWLVGDILDDVEAGRRAGCRTALVLNGGETEWRSSPRRTPDFVVRDLTRAARVILAVDRERGPVQGSRLSPHPRPLSPSGRGESASPLPPEGGMAGGFDDQERKPPVRSGDEGRCHGEEV